MSECTGLLFADGSILVLREGTTIETAKKEAAEHDVGNPDSETRVVSLVLGIVEVITEGGQVFRMPWCEAHNAASVRF
jgi:hypothetical protein